MVVEIGHFALVLALVVALVQTVLPLVGAHRMNAPAMAVAMPAATLQFLLVLLAFAALTHAYVTSDFSVLNVYQNSHSAKPMLYKVTGVWGNHEGSMVLWILMLSFLGALVAWFGGNLPPSLRARVLGIQALIAACFLAFSLLTSNPFARLDPVPLDGTDLNPLLQDPGLAFHPPFLYLGYVGFSIAFSFGVAALLEGRVDPAWARWVRPWTLLAWASLTLGIGMGSWWAYYELGWGGYWFWDPVENASLMPWLAGTALLHSAIVVEKRDSLKRWTILLAIVTFATSLLGTFLVRSGVLTSVHSFANDPERGQFLLLICGVLTGGALFLYALRSEALKPTGAFQTISRETALVANNVLLSVILASIMIGTFWPMVAELTMGEQISVGPPYFNMVTIPFAALLVLIMAAGTLVPWKRARLDAVVDRLRMAGIVTMVAAVLTFGMTFGGPVLAVLGIAMGVWSISGALTDLAERTKAFRISWRDSLARAKGLPRAVWGGAFAHAGVGVAILGMVGTSLWVSERLEVMRPGDTMDLAGYTLRFDGVSERRIANYDTQMGMLTLIEDGAPVATLTPERRWYPIAQQQTTEAAISPRWTSDVYVALGDQKDEASGAWVVRAYYHPMVHLLWGGGLLMTLGGIISLTDRRYRIGAPRSAKAARLPANARPAEA